MLLLGQISDGEKCSFTKYTVVVLAFEICFGKKNPFTPET
jgi:hypothetical protein